MKTITVFGPTGPVGKKVIERIIEKGLKPRAFTRIAWAAKFPRHLKPYIEIYQGDISEQDSIDGALKDTDAVVIALGTGSTATATTAISEGTENILKSMKKFNITTVSVCLSFFLFPEVEPLRILQNAIEEHKRMYELLKKTDLNYIAVFSPYIINKHTTDEVIISINCTSSPGEEISEKSIGSFLVDALSEPKYYKNVIGICNPPQT